jgi:hypothetical protein
VVNIVWLLALNRLYYAFQGIREEDIGLIVDTEQFALESAAVDGDDANDL